MLSNEYRAEFLDPAVWNRVADVIRPFALPNTEGVKYDEQKIRSFYKAVQDPVFMDHEIDRYEHMAWDRFQESFPECRETCCAEGTLLRFLENSLPGGTCTFLFWITDENRIPYFHCIFRIVSGRVILITTADRYRICPEREKDALKKCADAIRQEFHDPVITAVYTLNEWTEHVKRRTEKTEKAF